MSNIFIGGSNGSSTLTLQEITSSSSVTGWNYFAEVTTPSNTTESIVVTLPSALSGTKGQSITIKKLDNTSFPVVITPYGTDLIGDSTNYIYLYGQNDSITLCNTVGNSRILSDNRNSSGSIHSFIRVSRTSGQTTGISGSSPLMFNSIDALQGNNIAYNTSTYTFTLQPNITYKLTSSMPKVSLPDGGFFYFKWYNNTTSSLIGSGAGGDAVTSTSNTMAGCIVEATITPNVITTVKCMITGCSGSISSLGDSGNMIWAEVEEVSRASTVINTVDFLNVARIGNVQTVVTSGTDLVFNSVVAGNIPFNTSTGVATLTAGKTYELNGEPSFTSFSDTANGFMSFDWVDATTNISLISNSQSNGTLLPINRTAAEGDTPTSHLIYTPTANQSVKLRVIANSGTASLRFDAGSKAIIRQIGSTANTSVPTSMLDSSVVTTTGTQSLTNKTLQSPSLTGTPIAPTASANTNTTQIATTAFVINQIPQPSYMRAQNNSAQTVSTVGTIVAFTSIDSSSGSDITLSSNCFLLKVGKPYELSATVGYANFSGAGWVQYRWRTGQTGGSGTLIGTSGELDACSMSTNSIGGTPYATAIYTPTSDIYVHVEIVGASLLTSIGTTPVAVIKVMH